MDPSNVPPLPAAPPENRKHSGLGIASFILGILAVIFPTCFLFMRPIFESGSPNEMEVAFLIIGVFGLMGIGFIFCLVSIILGITGLVLQKKRKKLFGILGLALNSAYIFIVAIKILFFR